MRSRQRRSGNTLLSLSLLAGSLLSGIFSQPLLATTFVLQNADPSGFGLNDTTPASPVGGNPGTTIGEQRQNVVMEAGRIWAQYLVSEIPIILRVDFEALGGTSLAGASPVDLESDFKNAPLPDTWYPVALANSLADVDLQPGSPDIDVTINANIDDWYYGFDSNAPARQTDLLDVLLHEIGHGLGFLTITNDTTGRLFQNQPDAYARLLFDQRLQLSWAEMTNSQRRESATNDPFLTWTGASTNAAQRQLLSQDGFSLIAALDGVDLPISYIEARFGPTPTAAAFTGIVILANDGIGDTMDACETLLNRAELDGQIALIMRQECNFVDKVLAAQEAGAKGVIIYNNVSPDIVLMGTPEGFNDAVINIPAIAISQVDGLLLAQGQGNGVALKSTRAQRGTNNGRLRVYAPSSIDAGSSVSHWTTAASPNLLMEPFINSNLREDLDLTLTLMKDIGWQVIDIPYPHLSYEIWKEENLEGVSLHGKGDDPDQDGVSNLEEYFFGGNPTVADPEQLPTIRLDNSRSSYTFNRSLLGADLSYTFETSTNLSRWSETSSAFSLTTTPLGNNAETVVIESQNPTTPTYLRLRITTED